MVFPKRKSLFLVFLFTLCLLLFSFAFLGQEAEAEEEYEAIDSDSCTTCHEETPLGGAYMEDLSHSIHEGLECLACHQDKATMPHKESKDFLPGSEGCRNCHEAASEETA